MAFVHYKLAYRYTVHVVHRLKYMHVVYIIMSLCSIAACNSPVVCKNSHVKATHKCVLIDWGVCGWQDVGSGAQIQYLDVDIAGVVWSGIVVCVWLTRCRDEI